MYSVLSVLRDVSCCVEIETQRECKGNVLPYSLPSVEPRADPSVQAVIHSTVGCLYFPPGLRRCGYLPSRRASLPLAGTKLYCLVTEAYSCEQLAQGCYAAYALSRN